MKSLIALSLIIVAIVALVLVTHKTQQNSLNSITEQNSTSIIKQNSSIIVINNDSVTLSKGIYLLRNSSSLVYIVYYGQMTKLKIFNHTFVIAGPLSTFDGVLELQNATVYQKLQGQKEVTVQIYNGTSWKSTTLDIMYTSRNLQPYAFLVLSEEIMPF